MVPYRENQNWRTAIPLSSGPLAKMSKGSIYLAAPFTAAEERRPILAADNTQNTDPAETHGRIPLGPYRSALIEAASAMRRLGFSVTLPHKDVNDWGEKKLLPEEVMRTCTQQVAVCDLFVGILAQSCGSHYEFGLALGLGKPCLIIAADELPHSFVAQGSRAIDDTSQAGRGELMVQSVKTLFDIPSLFDREEVKDFLNRAVVRV
jgi:nucleoside 2-deoxyribosyltransferase